MCLKRILTTCFVLYFVCSGQAANDSMTYFFIYLKDKSGTPYSQNKPSGFLSEKALERRNKMGIPVTEKDLPVSPQYLKQISAIEGIQILGTSRWMNAVEIRCPTGFQAADLQDSFSFVTQVEYLGKLRIRPRPVPEPVDSSYYVKQRKLQAEKARFIQEQKYDKAFFNRSYMQIHMAGIDDLFSLGGLAVSPHIAVFDAGFFKAYRVQGMEDLLDENMFIRDFVDHDQSVWEDDLHGTNVLGFMKVWLPGQYVGSAPFARYSLFRTEDARSETKTEEVNWLFAAECADSLGVDFIASSVGYHTFSEKATSYSWNDLDGKTSIVARAANEVRARGILIVCSAGNEGNNSWSRIGTPADAPSCIAVGACDEQGYYANFSSKGPTADGRIKPDYLMPGYKVTVASAFGYYAGNGTSYSAPLFAGALATLCSLFPEVSYDSILRVLQSTATHLNHTDSAYGYGIPDFGLAACMLGKCQGDGNEVFWTRNEAVLFRDMVVHYKSTNSVLLKIKIKTPGRKKDVVLYKNKVSLKPGEWYRSSEVFDLWLHASAHRKKKRKVKSLILEFETPFSTYNRVYPVP